MVTARTVSSTGVIEILRAHSAEIAELTVEAHSIGYPQADWRPWFNGEIFDRDSEALAVLETFPRTITRGNLFHLADRVVSTGYSLRELKQLFVLTYAWGGGKGASAYRARVNSRLALYDRRFAACILGVAEAVALNDLVGAFEKLDNLVGAGESFLTKFLYFLARPTGNRPLPLIYDEQVKKSLRALVGERKWAAALGMPTNNSRAQTYAFYLNSMQTWSENLGCSPDQLELFLYRRRGRF